MMPYRPLSLYRDSKKLNALIEELQEYLHTKLFINALDILEKSRSLSFAKGQLLDRLGEKIGVFRPVLVDDTSTRYVITDEVDASFLESRKGKIYFSEQSQNPGQVFFKNPIGPLKKASDIIYLQFLRSYIKRSYQSYSHEGFIEMLRLFLEDRQIELTLDGAKIGITVSGTLSPLEISYFSGGFIPLPAGRIILYVKDENSIVYSDPHYIQKTA